MAATDVTGTQTETEPILEEDSSDAELPPKVYEPAEVKFSNGPTPLNQKTWFYDNFERICNLSGRPKACKKFFAEIYTATCMEDLIPTRARKSKSKLSKTDFTTFSLKVRTGFMNVQNVKFKEKIRLIDRRRQKTNPTADTTTAREVLWQAWKDTTRAENDVIQAAKAKLLATQMQYCGFDLEKFQNRHDMNVLPVPDEIMEDKYFLADLKTSYEIQIQLCPEYKKKYDNFDDKMQDNGEELTYTNLHKHVEDYLERKWKKETRLKGAHLPPEFQKPKNQGAPGQGTSGNCPAHMMWGCPRQHDSDPSKRCPLIHNPALFGCNRKPKGKGKGNKGKKGKDGKGQPQGKGKGWQTNPWWQQNGWQKGGKSKSKGKGKKGKSKGKGGKDGKKGSKGKSKSGKGSGGKTPNTPKKPKPTGMSPSGKPNQPACRDHYKATGCPRGQKCDFFHVMTVCNYYKKGTCRLGNNCGHLHRYPTNGEAHVAAKAKAAVAKAKAAAKHKPKPKPSPPKKHKGKGNKGAPGQEEEYQDDGTGCPSQDQGSDQPVDQGQDPVEEYDDGGHWTHPQDDEYADQEDNQGYPAPQAGWDEHGWDESDWPEDYDYNAYDWDASNEWDWSQDNQAWDDAAWQGSPWEPDGNW